MAMGAKDTALDKAVENLQIVAERQRAEDDAAIKRAVVNIKVFGVGGGGGNVLKRLAEGELKDVDLVAVNTDAHALTLLNSDSITCLQIGNSITKGHGTGGKVNFGEQAALNDEERLKTMMRDSDMIFITAGMGGGTGTGVAPVIAKIAKEQKILTVGVVTMPFSFEGSRKKRIADEGIIKMQAYMDALVLIRNDNLMKLPENRKLSVVDAFKAADSVLKQAIFCIAELILTTGFINVDFADVTTIFQQSPSSDAILGIGRSNKNAARAVEEAMSSPLTDRSLRGARGIILNITGDETLSLYEVNEAAEYIYNQTDDDVNIIFGTVIDKNMNGMVQATIIATDFVDSLALKSPVMEVPKQNVKMDGNFSFMMPKVQTPDANPKLSAFPAFSLTEDKDK